MKKIYIFIVGCLFCACCSEFDGTEMSFMSILGNTMERFYIENQRYPENGQELYDYYCNVIIIPLNESYIPLNERYAISAEQTMMDMDSLKREKKIRRKFWHGHPPYSVFSFLYFNKDNIHVKADTLITIKSKMGTWLMNEHPDSAVCGCDSHSSERALNLRRFFPYKFRLYDRNNKYIEYSQIERDSFVSKRERCLLQCMDTVTLAKKRQDTLLYNQRLFLSYDRLNGLQSICFRDKIYLDSIGHNDNLVGLRPFLHTYFEERPDIGKVVFPIVRRYWK